MARYFVDTEHVRGERRVYWVADRGQRAIRGVGMGKQVSDCTTDKRKAERQCDKLNGPVSSYPSVPKED